MDIETKIDELQELVSKYDTESFAGFFAYFLKNRPDPSEGSSLNKFESKLKDFLYLITLNVFSKNKANEEFYPSEHLLERLANKLNEIKKFNRVKEIKDYNEATVIHEMAIQNHFDNGVLSYVEQDLEKLKTVFAPFEERIIQDFGFDISFLVNIFKEIELVSMIRQKHLMGFFHTQEFKEFEEKTSSGKMNFSECFDLLPENIQQSYTAFHSKIYAHLMFSPEDLYHRLPKNMVDNFLKLFACEPLHNSEIKYYTSESPFELTPLIKLPNGYYLSVYGKQIPISIYKFLYNHFFKDESTNIKLREHREKSLERKVTELFKQFFPTRETFYYENYHIEKNFEQDLLIIHKGTAIIIEAKASKLREPYRDVKRAIKRLESDFKNSIQYGYNQCLRVENYFLGNNLFDIKDKNGKVLYTLNPNKIHTIYSIIVTLERFGPLQADLNLMLKKEKELDFPWSVYVDDLEIFLLSLKQNTSNPASKFLNFLKLRKVIHGNVYAIDELDICASYLLNPDKFKRNVETIDAFLSFSPYQQDYFDNIYHAHQLRFKEKPLPDDFYRFGIK